MERAWGCCGTGSDSGMKWTEMFVACLCSSPLSATLQSSSWSDLLSHFVLCSLQLSCFWMSVYYYFKLHYKLVLKAMLMYQRWCAIYLKLLIVTYNGDDVSFKRLIEGYISSGEFNCSIIKGLHENLERISQFNKPSLSLGSCVQAD